jgi:hypothetical protein
MFIEERPTTVKKGERANIICHLRIPGYKHHFHVIVFHSRPLCDDYYQVEQYMGWSDHYRQIHRENCPKLYRAIEAAVAELIK